MILLHIYKKQKLWKAFGSRPVTISGGGKAKSVGQKYILAFRTRVAVHGHRDPAPGRQTESLEMRYLCNNKPDKSSSFLNYMALPPAQ